MRQGRGGLSVEGLYAGGLYAEKGVRQGKGGPICGRLIRGGGGLYAEKGVRQGRGGLSLEGLYAGGGAIRGEIRYRDKSRTLFQTQLGQSLTLIRKLESVHISHCNFTILLLHCKLKLKNHGCILVQ